MRWSIAQLWVWVLAVDGVCGSYGSCGSCCDVGDGRKGFVWSWMRCLWRVQRLGNWEIGMGVDAVVSTLHGGKTAARVLTRVYSEASRVMIRGWLPD